MLAWMVESFPPECRLTALAIGYNFAQAVFGGSSPSVATWLIDGVSVRAPGYYLSFLACVSMFGLWLAPVSKDDDMKWERVFGKNGSFVPPEPAREKCNIEIDTENDRANLLA